MIIIFGTRLAGKVDVVPNLFYVRTQYGHIWYIPIIPLRSWIVLHGTETGNGWKGKQIPLSGKSVLYGWLRTAGIFGAVFGLIGLIINGLHWLDTRRDEHIGMALLSVALLAGGILVYWLCEASMKASRERAHHLGEQLGLPPELVDHFLDNPTPFVPGEGDQPPPPEEPPPYGMPSASPDDRWRS